MARPLRIEYPSAYYKEILASFILGDINSVSWLQKNYLDEKDLTKIYRKNVAFYFVSSRC